MAVHAVQVALANNETEAQIEDKLAGLCDALSFLGSSQAVVDCDKLSELPDVSFTIAGKEFGLTPEQYILKVRQHLRKCCRVSHISCLLWCLCFVELK